MGKLDADFSTFFYFFFTRSKRSFGKTLAFDFCVHRSYMVRIGNSEGNKILAYESTKYIRRLDNEMHSRKGIANSKIKSARAEMVLLLLSLLRYDLRKSFNFSVFVSIKIRLILYIEKEMK